MIVEIEKGRASGQVAAPPSKSMAHRYLICGALSQKSRIKGIGLSEDIKATLGCLEALGADVKSHSGFVEIGGISPDRPIRSSRLYCNESGSTLRFMIPICLLKNQEISLFGTKRLFERSLEVYEDLAKSQGITFVKGSDNVTVKGMLSPGRYSVRGDISSQFISGLMFALPNLGNDSVIEITGKSESGSYLGLTAKALGNFGVRISRADENTIYIRGNQQFRSRELTVEGDYSNAAFFESLNLFGSNVAVTNLSDDSIQGDRVYRDHFKTLVKTCPRIDISDCPDLGPILMVVAAACNGAVFTGTRRLKIKESDRGRAMAEELAKFGCKVEIEDDRIEVKKCILKTPVLPLSGHNDHRIVMAVAVLATLTGGRIYGAQAVCKSFPDFFDKMRDLGIKIRTENP